MALETWNGRTASQTDSDSPLDTTLMDGLRKDLDHLRQVLYGSTDPSFHTPIWGHNHDGTNSKLVVLASQTAGDYLLNSNPTSKDITGLDVYTKAKETKIGVGGTLRIKFTLVNTYTAGATDARIYRNGVAVGTVRSVAPSTTTEFSEDIGGWSSGDLVQVYGQTSVNGTGLVFVSGLTIYTAAPPIAGALLNY